MKPNLDILLIDTHDVRSIGFADVSTYPTGFNIISPSIQITPPTFNRITLAFSPRNATFYTSHSLGITHEDVSDILDQLPDGIWKLKYTIAPATEYEVEKTFLRTEGIQQKIGLAFLALGNCESSNKEKESVDRAWELIQGAISSANRCDEIGAMKKYRLADSILSNFLKTK